MKFNTGDVVSRKGFVAIIGIVIDDPFHGDNKRFSFRNIKGYLDWDYINDFTLASETITYLFNKAIKK